MSSMLPILAFSAAIPIGENSPPINDTSPTAIRLSIDIDSNTNMRDEPAHPRTIRLVILMRPETKTLTEAPMIVPTPYRTVARDTRDAPFAPLVFCAPYNARPRLKLNHINELTNLRMMKKIWGFEARSGNGRSLVLVP